MKNLNKIWMKISGQKINSGWEDKTMSLSDIWKITIIIFTLANLSIILFSWYIYLGDKIGGGYIGQIEVAETTYVKVINQKKLETDLNTLDFRQKDFSQLKLNKVKTVDPSL